jgi:hypothetical protein
MEEQIVTTAIDLLTPVMEGAIVAAAHYAKGCNRNTVTAEDVKYGMRYCAQHLAGKTSGTMFPEIYEDGGSDSDGEDAIVEVDEDDEPFTRYTGDDEILKTMNESYDNWGDWSPSNPLEIMLKSAINNSG